MRHGCLLAILVGSLAVGCQAPAPVAIPPQLHGTWRTDARKYERAHFELRKDAIVLGFGEGHPSEAYPVTAVTAEPQQGATFYRITYRHGAQGVDDTLAFYHSPAAGGLIRFKSQQDITWRKEGAER
jgi:hypothetical protein